MKDASQYVESRVFNTVPVSECNVRLLTLPYRSWQYMDKVM